MKEVVGRTGASAESACEQGSFAKYQCQFFVKKLKFSFLQIRPVHMHTERTPVSTAMHLSASRTTVKRVSEAAGSPNTG